jgi:hypothetical protein
MYIHTHTHTSEATGPKPVKCTPVKCTQCQTLRTLQTDPTSGRMVKVTRYPHTSSARMSKVTG